MARYRRRLSGIAAIIVGAGGIAPTAAADAEFETVCRLQSDQRRLYVESPGQTGRACDLRMDVIGAPRIYTPYHANNDRAYCAKKGRELAAKLVADGFVCASEQVADAPRADRPVAAAPSELTPSAAPEPPIQEPLVAEIQAQQVQAQQVQAQQVQAEQVQVEQAPDDSAVSARASADPASDAPPSDVAPTRASPPDAPQNPAADTAKQLIVPAEPLPPVRERLRGELQAPPVAAPTPAPEPAEPETKIANAAPSAGAGPVHLTSDIRQTRVAPAVRVGARPGHLVGGPPEQSPAFVAAEAQSGAAASGRRPEAVIEAVLRAHMAAWNEGDLEAFMQGYWRDPAVRFVSGDTVVTGWRQTMARYKERYGDGGRKDMGDLSFERLDVEMLSSDLALVVGGYRLDRDGETSTGAFTLVMRRIGGLWRIVHDHSSSAS